MHEQGPRERDYIQRINKIINQIIEECGGVSFDAPPESVLFLTPKMPGYDKLPRGWNDSLEQVVFIKGDPNVNPLQKAIICLHELIHMKAWLSVEVSEKHRSYDVRMSGMVVYRSIAVDKKMVIRPEKENRVIGKGLDEAVTADIEYTHWKELIEDNPYFADQAEWMKQRFYEGERQRAEKEWGLAEGEMTHHNEEDGWEIAPYGEHRKVLKYMEEEISAGLKISEEEAEKLFYRAYFIGKLLPLARAVKKVFGEGAFKKIMHMKTSKESAKETREFLEQQRKIKKELEKSK